MKARDWAEVSNLTAIWLHEGGLKASSLHMLNCCSLAVKGLGISKVGEAYQVHLTFPSLDMVIIPGLSEAVN